MKLEDITDKFGINDVEEHKLMGIISYMGVFVVIPILICKYSPFVRHNINQGLILSGIQTIFSIFGFLLKFIPFGGLFATVCTLVIWGIIIVVIINILEGKVIKIPIISEFEFIK